MELDVHIKREGAESWGFRLIGGKDFKIPLAVVMVAPDSPAACAGLRNGDVVCSVNGADASDMSHDSAKQFVDDAVDTLVIGVKRGLYDPVLDDYEPIYEPIDQEDSDQPSQPTEVDPFAIQQFLDPKLSREASELKDIEPGFTPFNDPLNGLGVDQTRSLTASPFVLPKKPYRPFSTEPLPEIPPLESPIILNPNYKDQFNKLDDEDEFTGLPETKFKLPISEQYDPDGTKKKRKDRAGSEVKGVKFGEDILQTESILESKVSEEMKIKTAMEEKMYMEKMKKELELDKIELTAVGLVDESIERAVSVTDEIKKEIDVELHESTVTSAKVGESKCVEESSKTAAEMTSLQTESLQAKNKSVKTSMASSEYVQVEKKSAKSTKEATELVELLDKTTEEIISYNGSKTEVNVSKEVQNFESLDKKEKIVDERTLSTKQEIAEVIESGSVRRKSEAFETQTDIKSVDTSQKVEKAKVTSQPKVVEAKDVQRKAIKPVTVSKSAEKTSEVKKEAVSCQRSEAKSSNTKTKTARRVAEQKAYTIGLQTIPNIKGTLHSSYHYNLLLKTFFIHLTDVMVALSRFILTEPVFDKTEESRDLKEVLTEQSVSEYRDKKVILEDKQEEQKARKVSAVSETKQEFYESRNEEKEQVKVEERVEKQEAKVSDVTQEVARKQLIEDKVYAEDIQANLEVEEIIEKQKLSGAQMAQVQERKSTELTHKMDAVISEFQTKAGIEESEVVKERRSRSRSQIEEEVAKDSDPLEWLSKVDQQQSQEITELKSESKSYISTSESVEKKRVESKHERRGKTSKSKEDKQMYVAIVESHVFTNKDAIFEESAADFSETSSVQSADGINVASQATETVATEKVSLESKEMKQEIAESVLEESRELSIVNAEAQLVQMAEEKTELKAIVEEVKEEKAEIKEEIQHIDVKQHEHVMAVSEKTEINISEKHESIAIQASKHKEYAAIKTEDSTAVVESAAKAVTEVKTKEIEIVAPAEVEAVELEVTLPTKVIPILQEEAAALKIVKEEIIEREQVLKLAEESELNISKHTEVTETQSQYSEMHKSSMESYESKELIQEASFTATLAESKQEVQESSYKATLAEQKQRMTLDLSAEKKLQSQSSTSSVASTIDTPTPSTVPPTPLTDEYVFKLHIPLPKEPAVPIPRDCTPTPEDEDPNIVKKKLIPYIDTSLESPVIYDPPLPTPPEDKVQSPVYTKPGLKGGSERRRLRRKEELLEIERKSSLLASAIDETIKSIEEYKEEVGIDTKKEVTVTGDTKLEESRTKSFEKHTVSKKEVTTKASEQPIIYNGYAKVETKVYNNVDTKIDVEWNKIDKQVKDTTDKLEQLSNGLDVRENGIPNSTEIKVDEEEKKVTPEPETKPVTVTEPIEAVTTDKFEAMETETAKPVLEFPSQDTSEPIKEVKTFEEVGRYSIKATEEVVPEEKPGDVSAAFVIEEKRRDPLEGYRPVQFHPEELVAVRNGLQSIHLRIQEPMQRAQSPSYISSTGELLGTHQGIVDGLEEAVVDEDVAKELGKPGMTEQKIAELISGESEMLREAHVMGLSRVLKSHMHRADDDSSVDFKKIKPIIESLKDSEVLKALNEELIRTAEEKRKEEEKKWTTFLQKPRRPVPRAKFGYYGYIQEEEKVEEPYKVKIVKQPKPKVAPDYKPENFDTGPLPWEERALYEPPPPPVEAEDPILIPEEIPEFLEAVDPLPESEVPDLEETGIPLPPPPKPEEPLAPELEDQPTDQPEDQEEEEPQELDLEAVVEETDQIVKEMEQNRLAEQLLTGVQNMVDPNASIDQQLAQMRAQVAALAQLPGVIQQTLELVTKQLSQLSYQDTQQITAISETQSHTQMEAESHEIIEVTQKDCETIQEASNNIDERNHVEEQNEKPTIVEIVEETKPSLTQEELEKLRKEEEEMLEEQRRIEKQKKEMMEQMKLEQESRQVKQRPTPRVGKPKPVFGPPVPVARPLVLPGGRKWRKPADAYNEQLFAETLSAQAELIQGKAKGINFMKYEKPPVSLDHLQHSDVYKLIHNMEQEPPKRLEMRTPVIAEADYREKCRSVTPSASYPQQVHP